MNYKTAQEDGGLQMNETFCKLILDQTNSVK